jgi:hypothetical protein
VCDLVKLLTMAFAFMFCSSSVGGQTPARTRVRPALDLRCLSAREDSSCGCQLKIAALACETSHTGWRLHFESDLHDGAPLRLNIGGRDISLRSRRPVTNSVEHERGDRWAEEYQGEDVYVIIRYRPGASTCPAENREDGCEYFDVAADVVIKVAGSRSRTYKATGTCGC